jgi:3',5'-cyclic AMP phosphodiesterase CpdA
MVGLRLEDALLAHLHPTSAGAEAGLTDVKLDSSETDGVRVMLVARSARERATESKEAVRPGNGIFALTPTRILKSSMPADMPDVLRKRSTYRFIFHKENLASVPAGLYDVRVEVLKGGTLLKLPSDREAAYEFQYNALRVFDQTQDEYPIISVTDTQVSTGTIMRSSTETPFSDFVRFVNTTNMPEIKNAPFIVFNGDLHQAGAYTGLSRAFVAPEYVNEMTFAIEQLKELPLPIHMIPGNHDGYASTGDTPSFLDDGDLLTFFNKSLESVIQSAGPGTWPDFHFDAYDNWRRDANGQDVFGGFPIDIYTGSFIRKPGNTFTEGWKEVPRPKRNFILYDGQYQWQRTIGPLNHSWKFRTSRFIGLNTFELRQHMRMAWGMYSTNYGGSMSPVQLEWLDRELGRANEENSEVTLLTHHDPRGGKGHNEFGTYHGQEGFEKIHSALLAELARYGGVF